MNKHAFLIIQLTVSKVNNYYWLTYVCALVFLKFWLFFFFFFWQDCYEDCPYTVISNKNTDHLISDGLDSEIKGIFITSIKTLMW